MYFQWVELPSGVEKAGKRTPEHWFETRCRSDRKRFAGLVFLIITNQAHLRHRKLDLWEAEALLVLGVRHSDRMTVIISAVSMRHRRSLPNLR
jgi:hypothetical protein